MLVNSEMVNIVQMLKLKADMLEWIGMLPRSYAQQFRNKILELSEGLAGPDFDKKDWDIITAMDENMNTGLNILLREISDDHSKACENCSKVLEVCIMLHEGSPIKYIQQKINDNWGDITAEDAPPPPMQVTMIPVPHGGDHIIELLVMGMMKSALRGHSDFLDSSDAPTDFRRSMTPTDFSRSLTPISSLIHILDRIMDTMPESTHPEQGTNLARAGRKFDDDDIEDVNLQGFPMPDKDKLN